MLILPQLCGFKCNTVHKSVRLRPFPFAMEPMGYCGQAHRNEYSVLLGSWHVSALLGYIPHSELQSLFLLLTIGNLAWTSFLSFQQGLVQCNNLLPWGNFITCLYQKDRFCLVFTPKMRGNLIKFFQVLDLFTLSIYCQNHHSHFREIE